jgi:drug/metabolite transporter (DMT)-like permease
VILGSVVAVLWGTADLFAAFAARRSGAFRTLATAQMTELAVCAAIWAVFPSLVDVGPPVGALLFVGVLTAASYGALYRGLMLGPVTLVAPIAAAYAVGPAILAVLLLDERLSTIEAVGGAATVAGVVIITATDRLTAKGGGSPRDRNGVAFGLAAMLGFAITAFMIAAFAQTAGWFTPLLVSRIGVVIVIGCAIVLPGSAQSRPPEAGASRAVAMAMVVGVCNLAGTAVYAHAAELGHVAVVSIVSALFPLIPIVGGLLLLRERPTWTQVIGIGVIIAGLVMLH